MYAPHGLLAVRCFLPSVLCVGVHDTYFQLPVPLHRPAEFRHFQQALGVGNDEDTIEAGPHPADFVDQLRHVNGGGLPDGSAADTLPDKPLTGTPYPADLFVEVGQFLIRQTDDDWLVLLRIDSPSSGVIGVEPLSSGIVISQYVAC